MGMMAENCLEVVFQLDIVVVAMKRVSHLANQR